MGEYLRNIWQYLYKSKTTYTENTILKISTIPTG